MHPELKAHPAYFEKQVVQLADNVYMAFGFAASNVYMIVGDDGLIIMIRQRRRQRRGIFWRHFVR